VSFLKTVIGYWGSVTILLGRTSKTPRQPDEQPHTCRHKACRHPCLLQSQLCQPRDAMIFGADEFDSQPGIRLKYSRLFVHIVSQQI